jgi:hypothetical protein
VFEGFVEDLGSDKHPAHVADFGHVPVA